MNGLNCYPDSLQHGAAFAPAVGRPARPDPSLGALMQRRCLARLERFVADRLFVVSDVVAMEEVVEELLDDPQFRRLHDSFSSLISLDDIAFAAASRELPAWLSGVSGPEGHQRAQLVVDLTGACCRAILQFGAFLSSNAKAQAELRRGAEETFERLAAQGIPPGPLAFLADRGLPAAVKRSLLARERAEVLSIALCALEDRPVARWLTAAIFDGAIVAHREHLRLLAALPGVEFPAALAPLEPLDLVAIFQDFERAERGYGERLAAAREAEAEVYPPRVDVEE